MPALTPYDLPITCERIYERAVEIVKSWNKATTDLEWSAEIFAAADEARKVEQRLH